MATFGMSMTYGEIPALPPVQEDLPNEIVTVTCLTHASPSISLSAALVAMLGGNG